MPAAGTDSSRTAGLAREWLVAGGPESFAAGAPSGAYARRERGLAVAALAPPAARTLLVEDEPGLAEVLALHLRAAGFAVDVAADGLAALAALERSRPDAVLLDLTLPRLSGFRLLELLRRDATTATVPVLVLTALNFQEALEVARLGADDFLTKPVAPATVVDRTRRMLATAAPGAAGSRLHPHPHPHP